MPDSQQVNFWGRILIRDRLHKSESTRTYAKCIKQAGKLRMAMNNTFFYTDVLKPVMAKKIVESLTTRPEWKDVMGGIGGIVVVKESTKISTDAASLTQVVIPNAAYFELTRISDTVDSLRTPVDLLGGYSHGLPKDIGDTAIGIRAISRRAVSHILITF